MSVRKRCLLWDYKNSSECPQQIDQFNFEGPYQSVSNWNSWVPLELNKRADFRPMVRDESCISGNDWNIVENTEYSIIHFFNEPDKAGIPAEQAAQQWQEQMVGILRNQKQKKLVSPSCQSNEAGKQWMDDFMSHIQDKPDYIGLHYYGTEASEAQEYIEDMYKKWEIPVIVSEIASISRDGNAVVEFTKEMANWLDDQEWVFEYGFFGCMPQVADDFVSPDAQLMNADHSWTPLMIMLTDQQPCEGV